MNLKSLQILTIMFVACWFGLRADHADEQIMLRISADADHAIEKGDYDRAERLLKEAIAIDSLHSVTILLEYNMGVVQLSQGRDSVALATLSSVVAKAPKWAKAISKHGLANVATGNYDLAIADFNHATRLDSTLVEPYRWRAYIGMELGELDAVEDDIRKLEQLDPEDELTAEVLSEYYGDRSDYRNAVKWLDRLVDFFKNDAARPMRAFNNIMIGELDDASADIAFCLNANPNDGRIYVVRALLNRARRLNREADADIKKAIELGVAKEEAGEIANTPIPWM